MIIKSYTPKQYTVEKASTIARIQSLGQMQLKHHELLGSSFDEALEFDYLRPALIQEYTNILSILLMEGRPESKS
jgi:hypothetical protein